MNRKNVVKLNEHKFQIAFKTWEISGYTDKKSYDRMFQSMYFAAQNMIKSEAARNCIFVDVEAKALDLTLLIFERDIVKDHKRPEKLSSYLYLPMLGILYGHQLQFEDKTDGFNTADERVKFNHEDKKLHDIISALERKEVCFCIYNDSYQKTNDEQRNAELRDSIKVEKSFTVSQLRDPDFVMKYIYGWEYHD